MKRVKICAPYEVPSYYSFQRQKLEIDGNYYYGTLYWLCKPLATDDKLSYLANWKNIEFYKSQSQYAPELVNCVMFVADKCIAR